VIKSADWVIDLGPEGGAAGGKIVATGTPEQVARNPHSHTGKYLMRVLNEPGTQAESRDETRTSAGAADTGGGNSRGIDRHPTGQ
jgi:excinuclease ABC subunit A